MDPIAFKLGPFAVRWYGILMGTAVAVGTLIAFFEAKRKNIDPDHILNLVLICVPVAFVGARLYYVAFNWDYYSANLYEIPAVWHGGLAIHGGLIGGLAAGYIYIRKKGLDFWKTADVMSPGIILGQAIGRWGNFFNQEAHGGPVSREFISRFPQFIQKGMFIDGQYYHPTFLYESLWNLAVFVVLLILGRQKFLKNGEVFLIYLALYSVGRFFIEGFRTDSLMLGPFRAAQVVSAAAVAASVFLIIRRRRMRKTE
ncbi:MAG TPA: prolipoprotein diacylglyceryl transferase [Peptococcaceae bacterium]|nr:MAG: Prolipoprotein diacylglyceryl transferase [Clostridia bacterium 41_269]HBT20706.1 prolipoprotein diacylglyceryl transferase [Peptococcaceae bacterium]